MLIKATIVFAFFPTPAARNRFPMASDIPKTCLVFSMAGFLTFSALPASAQTSVSECLLAPAAVCTEMLIDALVGLESAMADPDAQALARLQRVTTFLVSERPDLAETVLDDLPAQTRDFAIVEIMANAGEDAVPRGERLLPRIANADFFSAARDHHITNVIATSGPEAALRALEATGRMDHPIGPAGSLALADALASQGRLQDALDILRQGAENADQFDALLGDLVDQRLDDGAVADAQSLLIHLRDPARVSIATGAIAAALMNEGQAAQADAAFNQALTTMATIDSAERRFVLFDRLLRVSMNTGRPDWAVASARIAGSDPTDFTDALGMIVARGAGHLADDQWHPIVTEAIRVLEGQIISSPLDQNRHDNSWSQLAIAVAQAGDPAWAVELIARISDPDWRMQDLDLLISDLIDASQLRAAFELLPLVEDVNRQAQGYILLARVADFSGTSTLAEDAITAAYGLVEGPDRGLVDDRTISLLAQYEGRLGRFEAAEMRIRGLADSELRAIGHVINLQFAATNGSQDDLEAYLEIARSEIDDIPDVELQRHFLRRLALALIVAGHPEPALDLADAVDAGGGRDVFLSNVALILLSYQEYALAEEAIADLSDQGVRDMHRHQLLLAALRASLSQ